jgi:hypothetical protein
MYEVKVIQKGKSTPLHPWTIPEASKRLRAPDSISRHMNLVSFSALSTCRLYPSRNIPVLISVRGPLCGRKDYVNEKF